MCKLAKKYIMAIDNNIEINLVKIEKFGRLKERENVEFRTFLKQQNSDEIDSVVHRLNWEFSEQIDCTTCGNCCKKLKPCIVDQDIERLSSRFNISVVQVKEQYAETENNELFFKVLPCSFIEDKKCTIYNDRPEVCRSFPYLHKNFFTSRLLNVIENYLICPIVFNVLEKLKDELNFR